MKKNFKAHMKLGVCLITALGIVAMSAGCGDMTDDKVDETLSTEYVQENETESEVVREILPINENLSVYMNYSLVGMTGTSEGYYFTKNKNNLNYVMYMNLEDGKYGLWCNNKNCDHTDYTICSAYFEEGIYQHWTEAFGGYVYQIKMESDGEYLIRYNEDGSNLTKVVKLWDKNTLLEDERTSSMSGCILIHSGYVYYVVADSSGNMEVRRIIIDGSKAYEVVYKWKRQSIENTLKSNLKCDSNYVYISDIDTNEESFIIRYDIKTKEQYELYRRTKDGTITGDIKDNVLSFDVFDGGIVYNIMVSDIEYITKVFNTETKQITKESTNMGITVSYDGKYYISGKRGNEFISVISDANGNEIATIDLVKHFPKITSGGMVHLIGIDSRYFIYSSSVGEYRKCYTLDRRDVDKGIIKFEQMMEWY